MENRSARGQGLGREAGRVGGSYGYKKATWGILVEEMFSGLTVSMSYINGDTVLYVCKKLQLEEIG